ncbi:MAG: hypothetical protein RIS62_484, partial [Chloroflexota bacterium]
RGERVTRGRLAAERTGEQEHNQPH